MAISNLDTDTYYSFSADFFLKKSLIPNEKLNAGDEGNITIYKNGT